MSKKSFTIRLDQGVRENFQDVAKAAHLDDTDFAALWISRLSDLKREHALDALTSIPKHFFKGRPGRPSSSTIGADSDASASAA